MIVLLGRDHSLHMERRIVVYPHGYLSETRDARHCEALTTACGGDPGRVFDVKKASLGKTVRYAASVMVLARATLAPLVVLTETSPLRALSSLRGAFQQHAAIFETAVWVIYWRSAVHRSFPDEASREGKLEGDVNEGAFWYPTSGEPFLVLSSQVEPSQALRARAEDCVRAPSSSGTRIIEGQRSILGVRLGWTATPRR